MACVDGATVDPSKGTRGKPLLSAHSGALGTPWCATTRSTPLRDVAIVELEEAAEALMTLDRACSDHRPRWCDELVAQTLMAAADPHWEANLHIKLKRLDRMNADYVSLHCESPVWLALMNETLELVLCWVVVFASEAARIVDQDHVSIDWMGKDCSELVFDRCFQRSFRGDAA